MVITRAIGWHFVLLVGLTAQLQYSVINWSSWKTIKSWYRESFFLDASVSNTHPRTGVLLNGTILPPVRLQALMALHKQLFTIIPSPPRAATPRPSPPPFRCPTGGAVGNYCQQYHHPIRRIMVLRQYHPTFHFSITNSWLWYALLFLCHNLLKLA